MSAMKDPLLQEVKNFLEKRLSPDKPVLLGYSGGPDSKALLMQLLACRINLHIAHVDHGWREESKGEAEAIAQEAKSLGVTAHFRRLSAEDFSPSNAENQARDHRLQFFSEIYTQLGCQALVLGHHADDQAEVVLKRLFEGASIFSLGGLAGDAEVQGMRIWRPLISIPKKKILEWLEQKNLSYFVDPTNVSCHNLRGKMRQDILPQLATSFGKEIASNLCRLGEESKELKDYFSHLNAPILASVKNGSLDLRPFLPLPQVQLRFLLKDWFKQEKFSFSHQIIEGMIDAVGGTEKKRFVIGKGEVQIGKGLILINIKPSCLYI